jgi:hypothetical protein
MSEEKKLSAEDGLTLRTVEVEAYRAQAQLQDAQKRFQDSLDQLNKLTHTFVEKYGYAKDTHTIDLKTLAFVALKPAGVQSETEAPAAS